MGVTQAIGRVCGSGMLSLLAAISRYIGCDHHYYSLANKHRTTLDFPRVLVFLVSSIYIYIYIIQLPVSFDKKHSQLLKKACFLIMSGKGFQYYSDHSP